MREQIAGVPLLLLLVGKQIEYCFLCFFLEVKLPPVAEKRGVSVCAL
jgi:hypothetical protein